MGRNRKGQFGCKGGKKVGLSNQGLPKIYPPNGNKLSKELRGWADRKALADEQRIKASQR